MTAASKDPTAKQIWDKLSKVNVNEHTEHKVVGNRKLTYLSWAWAWTEMMQHYPQLAVKWHGMTDENGVTRDITTYPGGTASVTCSVTIGEVKREMWLPVMDHRNKAITEPDSFAINTAKMRCLTKAFALLGLGAYIYAGEDLPTEEVVEAPPQKKTKAKAKAKAKPAETPVEEKPAETPTAGVVSAVRDGDTASTGYPSRASLKMKLSERCKELYANDWKADKVLQDRIRKAVKDGDVSEMDTLLKMLDDVMPALLTLHEE
jgi:hypothetical protein